MSGRQAAMSNRNMTNCPRSKSPGISTSGGTGAPLIVWNTQDTTTLEQLQEKFSHKKRLEEGRSDPHMVLNGGPPEYFPIVYPEFIQFYTRTQLRLLEKDFLLADLDDDKRLNTQEIKYWMEKRCNPITEKQLRVILEDCDDDKDGKLSFREFLKLCVQLCIRVSQINSKVTIEMGTDIPQNNRRYATAGGEMWREVKPRENIENSKQDLEQKECTSSHSTKSVADQRGTEQQAVTIKDAVMFFEGQIQIVTQEAESERVFYQALRERKLLHKLNFENCKLPPKRRSVSRGRKTKWEIQPLGEEVKPLISIAPITQKDDSCSLVQISTEKTIVTASQESKLKTASGPMPWPLPPKCTLKSINGSNDGGILGESKHSSKSLQNQGLLGCENCGCGCGECREEEDILLGCGCEASEEFKDSKSRESMRRPRNKNSDQVIDIPDETEAVLQNLIENPSIDSSKTTMDESKSVICRLPDASNATLRPEESALKHVSIHSDGSISGGSSLSSGSSSETTSKSDYSSGSGSSSTSKSSSKRYGGGVPWPELISMSH